MNIAFEKINKLLYENPKKAQLYALRAEAQCYLGNFNIAKDDVSKALEIDSKSAEAYIARGLVHYKTTSENRIAYMDFDKAIKLNPKSTEAYFYRASMEMIDVKKIMNDLNKAIKLNPNLYEAYILKASFCGASDLALSLLDKAIEIAPNNYKAYKSKAQLKRFQRKYQEAIDSYTKAIELAPDNKELYMLRGNLYYIQKNY